MVIYKYIHRYLYSCILYHILIGHYHILVEPYDFRIRFKMLSTTELAHRALLTIPSSNFNFYEVGGTHEIEYSMRPQLS